MKEKKYLSPVIMNEIISLLGKKVLHTLLSKINESSPSWYSIIVDETSDASLKEQFNLSVRWLLIAKLSMKIHLD